MRIPDIDKLTACPRCVNLLEIENTGNDATVELRNPNVFGRCTNCCKSICWDAHVDPKPFMPLPFTCFYPSLDKGRLRSVVIDAQKECIRAIGQSGVDEALREDRQAVPAALRKRSVGVYDQQRESEDSSSFLS